MSSIERYTLHTAKEYSKQYVKIIVYHNKHILNLEHRMQCSNYMIHSIHTLYCKHSMPSKLCLNTEYSVNIQHR